MMDAGNVVEIKKAATPAATRSMILDELRNDFAEWMTAKRDLVWRPAIKLTKEGEEFAVRLLVPGVAADEVEILIAPDILLIKGETHRGEAEHTKILASVKFLEPVDPDQVHAELRDGMLSVRAPIAEISQVQPFMLEAA